MSNMSHCRFQNTLEDLRDCRQHMDDADLSEAEKQARYRLIRECARIADDYREETES